MSDQPASTESAEELYEHAPCAYVSTRLDGTIIRVNRTFEIWTGHDRGDLVGRLRLPELFTAGGRIYWDTHLAPLLYMQGEVREIAVEIVRSDGTNLPALMNAVLHRNRAGDPSLVRMTIFDATDRRLYERTLLDASRREHEIAHQLQQSLLSGVLPAAAGFDLGATYHPGVPGLDVGGDWYDAFWLTPGQTLALVVGDVVGRGIEAAATMGQLRSAVRALASTGLEPGAVVAALNTYAMRHEVGAMTTLVYAQMQLATGELRFACAGHPPPLLLQPGSTPEYLWEGRSPPLDSIESFTLPLPEGRRRLARGGVLLLYSDGLVEHPTRPLEDGMEVLTRELAAVSEQSTAELTGSLVHRLRETRHSDDICLLALRLDHPHRRGSER